MPKRRANGEGNIRKRKDGRWEGRYTAGYDPESGKRIIKNVLGKTQAEVKEKTQSRDQRKPKVRRIQSWQLYCCVMGADVVRGLRRTPHPAQHQSVLHQLHRKPHHPRNRRSRLDKLTTIQIQRFYNNLQKSGRSNAKIFPNSRTKASAPEWCGASTRCCTTAWSRRWRSGWILTNPAQGCKLPQLEKKEMEDPAARENRDVPCRSGAPWASRRLLSGADHRPAA